MQFGNVLVFAIVTESVFQWPGLGALFVEAIMYADRPIIAAYLMLAALVFIIVDAIVDVAICIADPRSRDKPMERAAP
jgi:peptide/nickel transport system permease protein